MLDLSGNPNIGDDGALSLIPILGLIAEVSLRGCKISRAVRKKFGKRQKRIKLPVSHYSPTFYILNATVVNSVVESIAMCSSNFCFQRGKE